VCIYQRLSQSIPTSLVRHDRRLRRLSGADALAGGVRKSNPCWKGYHAVGTKIVNGKTCPNCVKKK
jgi:hypothetical protein